MDANLFPYIRSQKKNSLGLFAWQPVAFGRGSVVYRSYVSQDDEGWYVLLAGFSETELLFLPEKLLGPYSTQAEAFSWARSLVAAPASLVISDCRLVQHIDKYVDALGSLFGYQEELQPVRAYDPKPFIPRW